MGMARGLSAPRGFDSRSRPEVSHKVLVDSVGPVVPERGDAEAGPRLAVCAARHPASVRRMTTPLRQSVPRVVSGARCEWSFNYSRPA